MWVEMDCCEGMFKGILDSQEVVCAFGFVQPLNLKESENFKCGMGRIGNASPRS